MPLLLYDAYLTSEQYGKVYKGMWQGLVVAVKSMVLPMAMTGAEKSQRMAVSLFVLQDRNNNVDHGT